MCPFCSNIKKIEVIDEPETPDQTLIDAKRKGQNTVLVDCPFCIVS